MIRKLITVCTLLLCVTSPAPGQSFSIESYLSDLTGASTNSILKSIYNADPETLNKILSTAEDADLPILSKLTKGLNLEFKTFDSGANSSSLGVGYSYSKTINKPYELSAGSVTDFSGLQMDFNADGNVAFEPEVNPENFLNTKFSFEYFRSSGGALPATTNVQAELNKLEDALAEYSTWKEVEASKEWKQFHDIMSSHLSTQVYFDIAADGGLESNQSFSRKQYTYGLNGALIAKGWSPNSAIARFNVFDYVPAAIRWASGLDDKFTPSGSSFPNILVGIDQVMPQDTDPRTIAGDATDYARGRVEIGMTSHLGRFMGEMISFQGNFRHYQEIDPVAAVRAADLDKYSFFTAAILLPKNTYVSYSTGKLPLSAADDQIYEAGFKFNF